MKKLVVLLVGLAVCGVVSPPLPRAATPARVRAVVSSAPVKRVVRASVSRVRVWVDAIAWHQCNFTPGWRCSSHRFHPVSCHADVRNQTWDCWGAYLLWKAGAWNWLAGVFGFHVPHYVVSYVAVVRNYPLGLDVWETHGRPV